MNDTITTSVGHAAEVNDPLTDEFLLSGLYCSLIQAIEAEAKLFWTF